MKNTEKGITLVALIITIVVLLILAVAAISNVQSDGIMDYANKAATKWEDSKSKEDEDLSILMDYFCTHEWEETNTPATCTEDGKSVKTCKKCGTIRTKKIEAGHLWDESKTEVIVEATCITEGEEKKWCSRCEEQFVIKEKNMDNHTAENADGTIRTRLGKFAEVDENTHTYYYVYECCQEIYKPNPTQMEGSHNYNQEGDKCRCGRVNPDI